MIDSNKNNEMTLTKTNIEWYIRQLKTRSDENRSGMTS